METRDPGPSPQSPVWQDDDGLWMKMDCVANHLQSPPVTPGERPQDETPAIPVAPTLINRYYTVMDDEDADDVFIPPPPPLHPPPAPPSNMNDLLPAEGSTDATANNSAVTLSNGAADATEAKANPDSLDWHHGEKQLMTAHNEVDEVRAGAEQTSKEYMDNALLSNDKDSTPPTHQDETSMDGTRCLMESRHDASRNPNQDNASGNEESNEEHEDIVILSEAQEKLGKTDEKRDEYRQKISSNQQNENCLAKEDNKTKFEDICGFDETETKLSRKNLGSSGVETNAPTLPDFSGNDESDEYPEPKEICKISQSQTEANQPQMDDLRADMTDDVDSQSLHYNLTKYDWVRRESGGTEKQVPQLPISKGSEEIVTQGEQEDGSKRIATDIQQGEQLLHRLQLVQLRHDVQLSDDPHAPQEVDKKVRGEEKGALGTEEDLRESESEEEMEADGAKMNLMEKEENEKNESKDIQPTLSTGEPEHHRVAATEAGDSDAHQSGSWGPVDFPTINLHETDSEISFLSAGHRLSAAETSIEKQIHEAAQKKQTLQRAGGIFNLAENPDVLEIPFKTTISLESLSSMPGTSQRVDWQFSEQKMQKKISQELQRELALVNQGKIPGGYSKGKGCQLKETKLLFEAFQQDNTEGPTRLRKLPTSKVKDHVYPSVLERTRSLEMFSLKSCPISKAHSLRLHKSAISMQEKSLENLRPKSPTGCLREKTRISPYSKQEKPLRLHRSMDCICVDVSTLAVETKANTTEEKTRQDSPLLKQNPFIKLRPALALQPEVAKDIREAKEREEELRRQRRSLYGERRRNSEDEEGLRCSQKIIPDVRQQSRGKLERVWPPPSKKDPMKSEQQEAKVHRAGGQRPPLWQRWESGMINGQKSNEKK